MFLKLRIFDSFYFVIRGSYMTILLRTESRDFYQGCKPPTLESQA